MGKVLMAEAKMHLGEWFIGKGAAFTSTRVSVCIKGKGTFAKLQGLMGCLDKYPNTCIVGAHFLYSVNTSLLSL